jgi:LPS export ABC transporter protein LptC
MKNKYLHINIITLFLATYFFIAGCGEKENTNQSLTKKAGVEVAKDVVVRYSVGHNRKAFLKAPLMYRVADTVVYTEFPKSVHVDFYDSDTLQSVLEAHYAKYKENESKIFLKDSVRVMNVNGDTLYCNELYWDRSRTGAEFYTDKPIRIRTRTHIINGIGLDAQQDFKAWHIVHPTGFLEVQNSEVPK